MPADLGAFERKINQGLHAHWFGDIQHSVEGLNPRLRMGAGFGDMLRPQAQQQFLVSRDILIARGAA